MLQSLWLVLQTLTNLLYQIVKGSNDIGAFTQLVAKALEDILEDTKIDEMKDLLFGADTIDPPPPADMKSRLWNALMIGCCGMALSSSRSLFAAISSSFAAFHFL